MGRNNRAKEMDRITKLRDETANFLAVTMFDWLLFLLEPPDRIELRTSNQQKNLANKGVSKLLFHKKTLFDFGDQFLNPIPKLIATIAVLTSIVVGDFSVTAQKAIASIATGIVQKSFFYVILFFIVALFYSTYSKLFRITITLKQTTYILLLICTPWIPVFTYFWVKYANLNGTLGILWIISFYLSCFYMLVRLAFTVGIVTERSKGICLISIFLPIILIVLVRLFLI